MESLCTVSNFVFHFWRSFHSIYERSLTGFLSISALWKRLSVNPEWILKPVDNFVEEFVWNHLVILTDVRWYQLSKPRENPPIFASVDEYLMAIDKKEVDVSNA